MDKTTILLIVEAVALLVAFLISKFLPVTKLEVLDTGLESTTNIVQEVAQWAVFFVHYARQHLKELNGSDKMKYVVEQLGKILSQQDQSMSEEQITAIAQKAYDDMKAENKE